MKIEYIDRGIYEVLRKELVAKNLVVDSEVHNTTEAYFTAMQSLKNTNGKGRVVSLNGVGSFPSREEKTDCKIIITRKSTYPSSYIGGVEEIIYKKNTNPVNTYTKTKVGGVMYDIDYEVRLICTSVEMQRILCEVILTSLKHSRNIEGIKKNTLNYGKVFVVLYKGSSNVSIGRFIEEVYSIKVAGVTLTEDEIVNENIPAIQKITQEIEVKGKKLEKKENVWEGEVTIPQEEEVNNEW